mgnify:CR=1 FL=1
MIKSSLNKKHSVFINVCLKKLNYYAINKFNFLNTIEINQKKYKTTLLKLGNHSVLAIIALIAIGSATRVMEAGLACPDWPLCYGTFLPLSHMNLRVFLEWFHRLDAFLVGILIITQFILSLTWRSFLPNWLPKLYSFLVFLIILQGTLGALTVINMLSSITVMSHLLIAFILLITAIYINQSLFNTKYSKSMFWWKFLLSIPLIFTLFQSIIGVRLSSTWSAHLCLTFNQNCVVLNSHKLFAIPVFMSIILILVYSLSKINLFKQNWKLLISLTLLLFLQITLGILSLKTNLSQPLLIVSHQVVASLLISTLATMMFRNSDENIFLFSNNNVILSFNS